MTMLAPPRAYDGPPSQPDAPARPGVIEEDSASVLQRVRDPQVDLVLWRRRLPDALVRWIADLPADRLPDGRVLARPKDVAHAVGSLLRLARTPKGSMRALFLNDVVGLAMLFAQIARIDHVDVRIEPIQHDSCKRFHRDFVPLRLLTTYRGPTTEWVPPGEADRAIALQSAYDGPIHVFPTHSIALFRGTEGTEARGVIHRSPPISGCGITRLVLCLNGPSAASPDPWNARTGSHPSA